MKSVSEDAQMLVVGYRCKKKGMKEESEMEKKEKQEKKAINGV